MKKQTKHFNKVCLSIFILGVMVRTDGFAQSVKLNTPYMSEMPVKQITIPDNGSFAKLYVEIKGGDGGNASIGKKCKAYGGSGASVKAVFNIGSSGIPPGSTLRFVRGFKGGSERKSGTSGNISAGGAGGGGSAVLYRKPHSNSEDDWEILAVAGGGGGAYRGMLMWNCVDKYNGDGGKSGTSGGHGRANIGGETMDVPGGEDGGPGLTTGIFASKKLKNAGGGGGANQGSSVIGGEKGYPAGGQGGTCNNCESGGFGFGGGGGSLYGGAGGGGYSGGGGGYIGYGGGGGSFLHSWGSAYLMLKGTKGGGKKEDGYVRYEFADSHHLFKEVRTRIFHPAVDMKKCMDVYGSKTGNGTRVQLWDCNDNSNNKNQRWVINGYVLKSYLDISKCLDLKKSNTSNGTDIHLWGCNGTKAQRWIYDGVSKQIRYLDNWNKCIDFYNGNTASGTRVQIWDCHSGDAQRWMVNDGITARGNGKVRTIHLTEHENKCLQLWGDEKGNGADIQLMNCAGYDKQKWLFDGTYIRSYVNTRKCLDLPNRNTKNGNRIQLWDCNDSEAQRWVYDGITGVIRYWTDKSKCFTPSGTTLAIYDCHNLPHQRWTIKEACSHDTTPPVAKCRNFTYADDIYVPTADNIDDGSFDECGIASRNITNIGGNTWRLTVKDAKGNKSSCTATVTKR